MAIAYQTERTGHAPLVVTVVLERRHAGDHAHDAFDAGRKGAGRRWRRQSAGVSPAVVSYSADALRKEIKSITGREVREAAAEVEPATGSVVHAFTTGNLVQVFLLVAEPVQLGGASAPLDDKGRF